MLGGLVGTTRRWIIIWWSTGIRWSIWNEKSTSLPYGEPECKKGEKARNLDIYKLVRG